jgi:hypothetical protein
MFQKGCFYFSEILKCCGSGSTTLPPYIFLPVLMQQMTLRVAYSNYECIFDFLLVRPGLPIDGEMNRCVNTKDGTLQSALLY